MALLDLFRSQPDWKHGDPDVRVAAVRRLPADEQDLLASIASGDADARVRRAALRRLTAVATVAAIARRDEDDAVRREALEVLGDLAVRASAAADGIEALEGLADPRALAAVAREAQHPDVRRAALDRIDDPRTLATIARTGAETALRVRAVERLGDLAAVAEIALKSDQKAVALAAVERVSDADTLRTLAEKARHRGAARRAGSRLAAVLSAAPAKATATTTATATAEADEAEETARWAAAQAAERERRARDERRAAAVAAREALVARVEALEGGDLMAHMALARAEWDGLEPLDDASVEDLSRRFLGACLACEERARALTHAETLRPQIEALAGEAEMAAGAEPVAAAAAHFARVEKQWEELRGATQAFPDLRDRYEAAAAALHQRDEQARQAHEQRVSENRARLEALCAALERAARAEDGHLKQGERLLRDARQALDHHGPMGPKAEREALLARLKAARAALYPKVLQWREDAEWKRWASGELREDLVRRVETLAAGATDLDHADRALRELEQEWRRALAGARDVPAELTARWQSAHDPLRARCDEHAAARQAEWDVNLRRKQELCERAEALADSTDWLKTAQELQRLQAEWKAIGPAHPRQAKAIWERFRRPCDAFFGRRKADLDERKHAWVRNLEHKNRLIARAEELARSTDWDAATAEIKRLQAEWKATGPVRKSQSESVWQRFRAACDEFFTRYKQRDKLASEAALQDCAAALAEAEGWLTDAAALPDDLPTRLHAVGAALRGLRAPEGAALQQRFQHLRQALPAAHPERFKGSDFDPEAACKRLEKLAERAEALVGQLEASRPDAGAGGVESVADQLRQALAANALGGKRAAEERQRALAEELAQLLAAWSRVPPVGEEATELRRRFESACSQAARALPREGRR